MSSKPPSSTTTTQEVPTWAQPYAKDILSRGVAISEKPYTPYTGTRIAGFSPEQESALSGVVNRANTGNAAMNLGQGNLESMLRGDYLNPESNPYFKNTVDTAMNQVQGRLNTQFNNPGAFGSSAHQEVMARGLGDVANQMYSQNYNMERANMMNALGMAPQYAQSDYQDLNALMGAGDMRRQYSQDVLNQQYADWLEAQGYDANALRQLGDFYNIAVGGQGITTQPNPYQQNTMANVLGAGLTGAGLLGSF
jgi:hypothetical protein